MRPPVFDVMSNGIEVVFGCSIAFLGMDTKFFAVQICIFMNTEYPELSIIFCSATCSWGAWARVCHILSKALGGQIC